MSLLKLKVRTTREVTDLGVPCREENFTHGEYDWSIPSEQTGLVLVDCWAKHPVESFCERAEKIAREKVLPAADACRAAGIAVIHAPAPEWANNYQEWFPKLEDDAPPKTKADADWPPEPFRRRQGEYAALAEHRLWNDPVWRAFHEANPNESLRIYDFLGPAGDDVVIADADHLHRCCRARGIMHLIYAGFATNICMQFRDYGMRAMGARGYNVMLLRDATTGIEFSDTLEGLWLTHAAIRNIEMKVGPSLTVEQFEAACRASG